MRGMSGVALTICIGILIPRGLGAAELQALVGSESAAILVQEGSITKVQLKNPSPALVPDAELAGMLTPMVFQELDPSILVESLYLYRKPPEVKGRPWSERERTGLFNAVRALSTLTGIQYYSASRETMRTFYESSTVIDGPQTKRPLADPVLATVPDSSELFARQKDLTFGDNLYRYSFHARSGEVAFVQENLTAMSYGIIPILGKNRLRTVVLVADADDYLLVYAASMAKAALLPGIEGKVRDSFSNRSDAVFTWFSAQADGAFAAAAGR